MVGRLFFVLIVFGVVSSMAATHVAVLETISEKDVIGRSEKMFLTDKLRERAKVVLPAYMGYIVMTRENINAMLPPGKSIEDCEGSCLVETGKNIAADYVAQARVGKYGEKFTITVELYETSGNNLIGSFTAVKKDEDGLLDAVGAKADDFFSLIKGKNILEERKEENVNAEAKKDVEDKMNDLRDGESYKVVRIGSKIWMAENLRFDSGNSWCYEDKIISCEKYGRLYNWSSAMHVCPDGWRLPSKADFEIMLNEVGGKKVAGKKLKSKGLWKNNGNGTDDYGFFALPSGIKSFMGGYKFLGGSTGFWSSTATSNNYAYSVFLEYDSDKVRDEGNFKNLGMSVRCLKE